MTSLPSMDMRFEPDPGSEPEEGSETAFEDWKRLLEKYGLSHTLDSFEVLYFLRHFALAETVMNFQTDMKGGGRVTPKFKADGNVGVETLKSLMLHHEAI